MSVFGSIWDKVTDAYHGITGIPTATERRDQARMVNDQIKAYRDQTEITKQEIAQKQGEESAEKRRIEEKQIRGLRRNYRPAGMLTSHTTMQTPTAPTDATPGSGVTKKLGA